MDHCVHNVISGISCVDLLDLVVMDLDLAEERVRVEGLIVN